MDYRKNIAGFTLIELILAVLVGSIILAGSYASYSVVAAQYNRNSAIANVRDFAVPTIKIVSRDIRMAGYVEVDDEINSALGNIPNPITISNGTGINNSDSVTVVYDVLDPLTSNVARKTVTYYVAAHGTDLDGNVKYALFLDSIDSTGAILANGDVVADYVDDFQVSGSNPNSSGFPTLVSYNIVFHSRNKTNQQMSYDKADFATGDHDFIANDNYYREDFDASVLIRNLIDL